VKGKVPAGFYRVQWDAKDDRGKPLSSGIYFSRLVTSEDKRTRRMILLR
jgi:flagellar hook assembly protein FlgD